MITTRHNLHGSFVLQALRAGKHVFVEKPLSLMEDDLKEIEQFYAEVPNGPVLMVGFNRRFSPAIKLINSILKNRTTPIIANYRMNAGFLPPEHWVHGPEGGGRNIGEACHIYDLFTFLTNSSKINSVTAYSIAPTSKQWRQNDNFVATLKYSDGSVCTLTYTALGAKSYPKEKLEVFSDGKVIVLEDYKSVKVHGSNQRGWSSTAMQKGQKEELEALAATLSKGENWPISLEDQLQATRVSFEVENQIS
jgi:predicted dehydrogenase